jgi:hypothetical protein
MTELEFNADNYLVITRGLAVQKRIRRRETRANYEKRIEKNGLPPKRKKQTDTTNP